MCNTGQEGKSAHYKYSKESFEKCDNTVPSGKSSGSERMASSTTTWLLLQWIEDPPQWDVIEVGKCGAELKLMALGKKLRSAVGNIYDVPWNGETAPAKVLDFGKKISLAAYHMSHFL